MGRCGDSKGSKFRHLPEAIQFRPQASQSLSHFDDDGGAGQVHTQVPAHAHGAPQALDRGDREQDWGSATPHRLDYAIFDQLLDESDVQAGRAGKFLYWKQELLRSPQDESAGFSGFGIRADAVFFDHAIHAAATSGSVAGAAGRVKVNRLAPRP
jgi:hypothetical protein